MKVQGNIKALTKALNTYSKDFDQVIESLQKSYITDLVKYQEDLLLTISSDYNLNYDEMHTKYIKNFKKNFKKTKNSELIEIEENDTESTDIQNNINEFEDLNVLEKKIIDDKTCFIENKEGGSIYNREVIKIGEVKDGSYVLYKKI